MTVGNVIWSNYSSQPIAWAGVAKGTRIVGTAIEPNASYETGASQFSFVGWAPAADFDGVLLVELQPDSNGNINATANDATT